MKLHFIGIGLVSLLFVTGASAYDIPINDGFVTDDADLLSDDEESTLESKLLQFQKETSNEIAILTIPSLSGAVASDIAVEIGRKWGVGTENNNGILMLISYADREIWIATGYGLEGAVPDLVAHGIAAKDMTPYFRDADYFHGIEAGINALQKHIGGEYTADRYSENAGDAFGFLPWVLFFILTFFDWVAASLARTKSWWAGGLFGAFAGLFLTIFFSWWISIPLLVMIGSAFDYIVSKKGYGSSQGRRGGGFGGWGGGGGFGGGSGGFGGFGGGSFGGGGGGSKW